MPARLWFALRRITVRKKARAVRPGLEKDKENEKGKRSL
jgi:hypothetical protein